MASLNQGVETLQQAHWRADQAAISVSGSEHRQREYARLYHRDG